MKKCKSCKVQFEPRIMNGIKASRCDKCEYARQREKQKLYKERAEARKKGKKKMDVTDWGKKAWTVFSIYVRKHYSNGNGYVQCFTCDTILPATQAQAGHCFHKGYGKYKMMDFTILQIRPQCRECNEGKGGNLFIFRQRLTEEIGAKRMVDLARRRYMEKPLSIDALKNLHFHFKERLKEYEQ